MRISGLDHIVLNCTDVERSAAWYHEVLGLELERMDEWRRGEVPFPSLRLDGTTIIDLFAAEPTGTNLDHFALVVDADVAGLRQWAESGELDLVSDTDPVERFGAQGQGRSIYVKDPDGTTVELRTYR
jgi:catechol 2,3-dioxygenase-like lactoylglutathione lyase family enzyme